jgi:hypothetical protein
MHFEKFSFLELEKKLEKVESIEEKIALISYDMMRCKKTNHDVKDEMKNTSSLDIKLIIKTNGSENKLLEILDYDKNIKNELTREFTYWCGEKLLEHNKIFLERAQISMDHYQTILDIQMKCMYHSKDEKFINNNINGCTRIIWRSNKEKLLALFDALYKNEILPEYSRDEIFLHFSNEKQIPLYSGNKYAEQFCWKDSDCRFAVLVDELAKRGIIDDENKFKIFTCHFVNKRNNPFKGLAQKRSYTDNYTEAGNLIREILNSIGLISKIISLIVFNVI